MKLSTSLVICSLCVSLTLSVKTHYKAAVTPKEDVDSTNIASIVHEASKAGADILLFPSLRTAEADVLPEYYDETVMTLSNAAKQANVYIVANLLEKIRCQNKYEIIRNNMAFDRQGSIVSMYKKPVNQVGNCTGTSPNSEVSTFTTDFGVTFGILMEEDVILQNPESLKNLKNFVVTRSGAAEIPFLSASQFLLSWAYTTKSNLISAFGINGVETGTKFIVAELDKDGAPDHLLGSTRKPETHVLPNEDLSQYIIKPMDLEASVQGYKETVCQGTFCCKFHIKTSHIDTSQEVSYGLAAFDGVRHFGRRYNIGAQSCSVFACAGVYKRSCLIGSEGNNTDTRFEKIVISANFSDQMTAQYPFITADRYSNNMKINSSVIDHQRMVTIELVDSKNMLSIGIFGRDFSKDYEALVLAKEQSFDDLSGDIYDEMQEMFDYLWIRLRVMMVVVSIYILEML